MTFARDPRAGRAARAGVARAGTSRSRPARVRVEPAGFDLAVMPGETILDAAFRTGATWPTICYGQARCTACALLLRDGHENAGLVGPVEEGVLRQITGKRRRWPAGDTRLACQLTVTGEVTVEKKGAKPPETESLEEEETA